MGIVEPGHLVVILLIVLIVFGPGKIADVGGQLGRGIREFRQAAEGKPTEASKPNETTKAQEKS